MSILSIWLIAYAVPALAAGTIVKLLPGKRTRSSKRSAAIINAALIISICLSQYFIYASGFVFPWYPNLISIIAYSASILIALFFIPRIGLWYGLSALTQELTMLSIAFLLLPIFPLYIVMLLVVPLFVWCHPLEINHRYVRLLLFTIWGVISVFLFSIFPNVYLIAALHTVIGAMLISRSILYSDA